MALNPDHWFVPDDQPLDAALDRVTVVGIAAHPDDLEVLCLPWIHACGDGDDAFAGVVCADGAGSVSPTSVEDLVAVRATEQHHAALVGGYAAVAMLGASSFEVRRDADTLTAELVDVLTATRPGLVVTHNPADKHATHVAVCQSTLAAIRAMPSADRPSTVYGVESWRDLDWLPDDEKIRVDCTEAAALGEELLACFSSQLDEKRYDLAVAGRRRANATLFDPYSGDHMTQTIVAIDLTPLVLDDRIDLAEWVTAKIDRFRAEVADSLTTSPQ